MIIDAYAHVGSPRFGKAEEVLALFDRWNIDKGILVLGPWVPDLEALKRAHDLAGDRIRYMGIPHGNSPEQKVELANAQLKLGISGMRYMPFELEPGKTVMNMLGERGLWLFAINPYQDAIATRALLDWLTEYPDGKVASPHFLIPHTIDEQCEDPALFRELLRHPRFYAILSRHGGVGSTRPYPHDDLKPWVEEIAALMGWDRLMWGSEFPVMYWRNEQIDACRNWISMLDPGMSNLDLEKFLGLNAQRLFFDEAAPPCIRLEIPQWLEQQYNREGNVQMLQNAMIEVPMSAYAKFLSHYLKATDLDKSLSFAQFIATKLKEYAETLY